MSFAAILDIYETMDEINDDLDQVDKLYAMKCAMLEREVSDLKKEIAELRALVKEGF